MKGSNIKRIPPDYVEELVSVPTQQYGVLVFQSEMTLDFTKNVPVVWVEMEDDLGTDGNVVPVTRHPQVKVIWKGLTPTQQHTVKTQCGSEPV